MAAGDDHGPRCDDQRADDDCRARRDGMGDDDDRRRLRHRRTNHHNARRGVDDDDGARRWGRPRHDRDPHMGAPMNEDVVQSMPFMHDHDAMASGECIDLRVSGEGEPGEDGGRDKNRFRENAACERVSHVCEHHLTSM
jgi:hypothetical protein